MGVSRGEVEEGGEICLLLAFVLGSGEHFRGQGESHAPKVQTTLASLRPHIYEHGSPFPKWGCATVSCLLVYSSGNPSSGGAAHDSSMGAVGRAEMVSLGYLFWIVFDSSFSCCCSKTKHDVCVLASYPF